MRRIKLLVLLCYALSSANVMASGNEGHKTVGAIADRLLKGTNAGAKVKALLQSGESLQSISIWADCVKGEFCGLQTSEMLAFTIQNPAHSAYHYTNTPVLNKAYVAGGVGTSDHDIVQILKQAIAVLQGNDTTVTNPHHFSPRQALLMVAHLVGDIHQPLHVATAYINSGNQFVTPIRKQQVDGINIFDVQGGNHFLLEDKATWTAHGLQDYQREQLKSNIVGSNAVFKKSQHIGKSLHQYWDVTVVSNVMHKLGANSIEALADKLMNKLMKNQINVNANIGEPVSWPEQWANESLALAKIAYADLTVTDKVTMKNRRGIEYPSWYLSLPTNYIETSTEITQKQIGVAGYRLAALLKKIWP